MQINAKKVDGANAIVDAKVSATTLGKKVDKIAAKAAKSMKVDGFRQGKVPIHVVKARHGDQIKQDAEQDVLKELFDKALKQLDMSSDTVVGEPQISKFDRVDDGLEIEVKISFKPTINVSGYKELVPEYKTPRIMKKDIEARIKEMLKSVAPMKKVEEKRAVKVGDFALIDFDGYIDGESFPGGKAEKYLLEVGSGSFIPGFEDQLVGMKAGENKDIKVTFPKEYNNKELAGKDTVFKVVLHDIEVKDMQDAPDEETLKKLLPGVEKPTLKVLEDQVKKQLKNEKLHVVFNEEVKPKYVETILEKIQFDLPENIVDQEIDMQVRNIFSNLSEDEIKEYSKNPKKIEEKRAEYADEAKKSVKLTFLVDELAKQENISVDDQEVMQMIYFEAMQQGQDPKKYFEYYEKQGLLPAIKMSVVEEKLFTKLFTKETKEVKEK
ncbi:MAG: trigger factor [Campylobacteraceae bacterium]|nr:trigger factor [Campylobacteraceae bacterium]